MTYPDKAICGNCGKEYRDHHHGTAAYCYDANYMQTFSNVPSDAVVGKFVCEHDCALYKRLVAEWRRQNGHSEVGSE